TQVVTAQYHISFGIRGDNTPGYARYLGYLDGKELYPDFRFVTLEEYIRELLEGQGKMVYGEKVEGMAAEERKRRLQAAEEGA
ncbi:isoflavone reductase family protein, partial [Teratosphaeria destructans]